ncbi:MAG: hypothetical protein ACKO38_02195 [Planctomycetota bacterium]
MTRILGSLARCAAAFSSVGFASVAIGNLLIVGWLVGCRPDASTVGSGSSPATTAATASPAAVERLPAAAVAPRETFSPSPAAMSLKNDVAANNDTPSGNTAEPPTASPPATARGYRVLLLVPGGPLLFEFMLKINGQPLEARHAERLARYRREADSDGDGRVTWDELLANDALRTTFLADAQLNSDRERVEFLRNYDMNGNREVDDNEWPRVFRQTTVRGRPFAVLNRDDDREWNREQSPLFKVLDSDENHRLDADESRLAAARLRQLDADDDERLTRAEVMASRVETAGRAMPALRRSLSPAVAWEISSRTDWSGVMAALQTVYSGGGPLAEGCFPTRPSLFAALDRDGNRRLARRELETLAELPPTAIWSIDWRDSNDPASQPPSSMTSGPSVIELSNWNGEAESANTVEPAREAQPAREVVPERLSDHWQMPLQNARMIIFPVGGAAGVNEAAQVRVVASFPPDALWTVADADGDGQLLGQEMETLGTRLLELDRDGSGDIAQDELPELIWLAVARGPTPAGAVGPPPTRTMPFNLPRESSPTASGEGSVPPGSPTAGGPVPDWFDSLDSNGDGQISQREFPGERALFQRLDTNSDGQLTVQEASRRP